MIAIHAAEKIAKQFADSHLLGTCGDQYLTNVRLVNSTEAQAIIGEEGDKSAYTAQMRKLKKGWVILSYHYTFIPTGKEQIDTLTPPFPNRVWDKIIRQQ